MHQNFKVSVCLITYGQEEFIEQAINSVLMQKCDFDLEVILANDCSPDNTDIIIQNILQNHPNSSVVKYIRHEKNIGMMSNFIFAIQQCKGKYVAICEGDDYWIDENKLQKQINCLENNPQYSLCFHDVNVIEDNKKLRQYVNKNETVFQTKDLFERHFIPTVSIVFRNIIQFPNWLYSVQSGDKALLLLASLKGDFKYLPEVLAAYRIHGGGISKTHYGVKKVYDTANLLNFFNADTSFKYTKDCHSALLYEIETHVIPHYSISNFKIKDLVNEILNRVYKKIKKKFK